MVGSHGSCIYNNEHLCTAFQFLILLCSGGFRNLERGVQPLARKAQPKILGLPRPLPVT